MRDKILFKASEMFLNLGFKSVTMDDIANEMGVSKKTIYTHFVNKTDLVEKVTLALFDFISQGIDMICSLDHNPIQEIYDIKKFVMKHLKDEKSSPQYQLQKYYPKLYATLKKKQLEVMNSCVEDNLNRGIKDGLYRESINVEFVSRIYFNGINGIKDLELFPLQKFSLNTLMEYFLEYHLRGICTEKGIKTMNQIITTNKL
jgi:AcrR family transcriptional regulator